MFPFFYFLLISSVTPGPNNVMLTASGMNFGYKRTLPHIAGICTGFSLLITLCAFGLGALYQSYPVAQTVFKFLGAAYLLYLTYKVLTAGQVGLKGAAQQAVKPITFIEAFGFQFINPKGVLFSVAAISLLPDDLHAFTLAASVVSIALTCSIISSHIWAFFGQLAANLFRNETSRKIINVILALLLLATLPMMLL